MKIILYSCNNSGEAVYNKYEKKYKDLGFEVLNPYDRELWQGDEFSTVRRYIEKANMLVIISKVIKSKDLIALRRYCFNNFILFRQEIGENTMHYSWWYNDKKI